MKRALVAPITDTKQTRFPLSEGECHHLLTVLRVRNGDPIEAIDGQGNRFAAEVVLEGKGRASLERKSPIESPEDRLSSPVHLEMAVLKGEAMEWVIEKSVELGIRVFQPILTDHTVVQIDRKGPEAFRERWQKIADESLKQCGRLDRMEVRAPRAIRELLQHEPSISRLWCFEGETEFTPDFPWAPETSELRVLIGPEGGFSAGEIQLLRSEGIRSIRLGPWILRAETAAIFAASIATHVVRKSEQRGDGDHGKTTGN